MKELRRKDRKQDIEQAKEQLKISEYGILSTVDNNGCPYGVPLNYVYQNDAIYFHCALVGHKLENIENNPKVSFCVVGDTEVIADKFSCRFTSTIVFGKAVEVKNREKDDALVGLLKKYSSNHLEKGKEHIEKCGKATKVIKINIEHISSKQANSKKD